MGRLQVHSFPRASTSTGDADGRVNGHENLLLMANVGRIMKDVLPPQAKISKWAKETIQESATEFIGFITGEASKRCRQERRKMINGDDICHAMRTLGLDHYARVMNRYLQRFCESEELAASLNNDHGSRAIQIDVRAQLSVSKGKEQQDRN